MRASGLVGAGATGAAGAGASSPSSTRLLPASPAKRAARGRLPACTASANASAWRTEIHVPSAIQRETLLRETPSSFASWPCDIASVRPAWFRSSAFAAGLWPSMASGVRTSFRENQCLVGHAIASSGHAKLVPRAAGAPAGQEAPAVWPAEPLAGHAGASVWPVRATSWPADARSGQARPISSRAAPVAWPTERSAWPATRSLPQYDRLLLVIASRAIAFTSSSNAMPAAFAAVANSADCSR